MPVLWIQQGLLGHIGRPLDMGLASRTDVVSAVYGYAGGFILECGGPRLRCATLSGTCPAANSSALGGDRFRSPADGELDIPIEPGLVIINFHRWTRTGDANGQRIGGNRLPFASPVLVIRTAAHPTCRRSRGPAWDKGMEMRGSGVVRLRLGQACGHFRFRLDPEGLGIAMEVVPLGDVIGRLLNHLVSLFR